VDSLSEERLNERKIEKIQKWVVDREERGNNVIIKGVKLFKELEKDWGECRVGRRFD